MSKDYKVRAAKAGVTAVVLWYFESAGGKRRGI